jgi:hypothetical protein
MVRVKSEDKFSVKKAKHFQMMSKAKKLKKLDKFAQVLP